MTPIDPIDELMFHWEAARRQGDAPAPEVLCADCPHLADELRGRIGAVLAMEQLMGVTEPDPRRTILSASGGPMEGDVLPSIPGYELSRIIDQGGMGVVYEARQ